MNETPEWIETLGISDPAKEAARCYWRAAMADRVAGLMRKRSDEATAKVTASDKAALKNIFSFITGSIKDLAEFD